MAHHMSTESSRQRRAWLIVVGILVVGAVAVAAGGTEKESRYTSGSLRIDPLLQKEQEVADYLEEAGYMQVNEKTVPAWFEQEIVELAGVESGFANADWSVVDLVKQEEPDTARELVCNELLAKGWLMYESGEEDTMTLVKAEGECRWMMLTCVKAVEGANVLLRIQRA